MGAEMEKADNRGMSLVEIIIVIALMTVITGVAGYGISLIGNKPVEECAKKVEMALNRNRTNSMGKLSAWLEFYMEDGCLMVKECLNNTNDPTQAQSTTTVIGAKDVYMSITYDTGSPHIIDESVTEAHALRVAFARDSGAVRAFEIEEGGSAQKCKQIIIYKGSYEKVITLDLITGRVKMD